MPLKALPQSKVAIQEGATPPHMVVYPYAQEAEEAVLGGLLLDSNVLPSILSFLAPEDFFLKRHEYIYRAMLRLFGDDKMKAGEKPVMDYVTITQALRNMGHLDEIGGQSYLMQLVTNTPSSVHTEVYARLVERAALRRTMLKATDTIRRFVLDENMAIDQVIQRSDRSWQASIQDFSKNQEVTWGEYLNQAVEPHLDYDKYKDVGVALEMPFPGVNIKLRDSEQTLVSGLSGTGKSALMLWLLHHLLTQDKVCVFVSLEMSKQKILNRMLAMLTGIPAPRIETRQYMEGYDSTDPYAREIAAKNQKKVIDAFGLLSEFKDRFHIIEEAKSVAEINRAISAIAYRQDVHFIGVDYLKLVKTGQREKEFERCEIALQAFQQMAKDYVCPLMVLHQNKTPKDRADKTPYLDDMYFSGYVKPVPDLIYALHRDDHSDFDIDGAEKGRLDIFELKDRNGGDNRRRLAGHLHYLGNEQYAEYRKPPVKSLREILN